MRVVVVTGPPCAGKSTYVAEHRDQGDVVIDMDDLARALGYPHAHLVWPTDHHVARTIAVRVRASAIKAVREACLGMSGTAWVIASRGGRDDRRLAGADVVDLDPGVEECYARAAHRADPAATRAEIDRWYASRDPAVGAPSRSW